MSIVSDEIIIKVGSQQVKYYKSLGYENVKFRKELLINISDLPLKSMVYIDVRCDNEKCKSKNCVRYQDYNKSINKYDNYYCVNCRSLRIKETCIKKYGVKSVFSLEEVKLKRLNTFIKKYGVDHPMKNESVKAKMKQTHINNFGCHYSKTDKHRSYMSEYIISRCGVGNSFLDVETMKKRYGVKHPSKSIEIMLQRNKTNIYKYGNVCSLHGPEIKLKTIDTLNLRFGVDTPFNSELIRNKIKNTIMLKYGVNNVSKDSNIHNKKLKTAFKINNFKHLKYQGSYELDFLNMCNLHGLISSIDDGLSITYYLNDVEHIYHSDFYISELNLIVEIKSSYFYQLEYDKNMAKRKSCLNNGYNFLFIIDKDYTKFQNLYM